MNIFPYYSFCNFFVLQAIVGVFFKFALGSGAKSRSGQQCRRARRPNTSRCGTSCSRGTWLENKHWIFSGTTAGWCTFRPAELRRNFGRGSNLRILFLWMLRLLRDSERNNRNKWSPFSSWMVDVLIKMRDTRLFYSQLKWPFLS